MSYWPALIETMDRKRIVDSIMSNRCIVCKKGAMPHDMIFASNDDDSQNHALCQVCGYVFVLNPKRRLRNPFLGALRRDLYFHGRNAYDLKIDSLAIQRMKKEIQMNSHRKHDLAWYAIDEPDESWNTSYLQNIPQTGL